MLFPRGCTSVHRPESPNGHLWLASHGCPGVSVAVCSVGGSTSKSLVGPVCGHPLCLKPQVYILRTEPDSAQEGMASSLAVNACLSMLAARAEDTDEGKARPQFRLDQSPDLQLGPLLLGGAPLPLRSPNS